MTRDETTVLVVGAGPVGLTASILLSRCGIRNVVLDRREGPHRAPQAHVVNPRSLEIFRQVGIDSDMLRACATRREDAGFVRWMTRLDGIELGALPYERQGDENLLFTPTPLLNLSQHILEPILLERARSESAATVRYEWQWESLEDDGKGVTSRGRDLVTGEAFEVRSRYVLAADGASSPVRRALGIEMVGPDRLQSFVMIHFEANLRALVRERPAILYWLLDPGAPGALVAHDIEKTWVLMHPFDPDLEKEESYTEKRCAELVSAAIGPAQRFEVRNTSIWRMTAQIAKGYRSGRTFLVGDSAHRFPPSGGMGMNTGIQDAHNLVWKIAGVENGWAKPSLLESYEEERRPVAQNNSDQSLVNAFKMLELAVALGISNDLEVSRASFRATLENPASRAALVRGIEDQQEHFDMFGLQLGFRYASGALVPDGRSDPPNANPVRDFVPALRTGSRLSHAFVAQDGRRVSTLDLAGYDACTLVCGRDGLAWERALANTGGVPVRCVIEGRDFEDGERNWKRVREIGPMGAILLRPDQHVAWYDDAPSDTGVEQLLVALAAVSSGAAAGAKDAC